MVELSTTTGSPSHSGSGPNPCVSTIDLDSSTAGSSQVPVCVPDSGIASSSCGVSPASSSTSSESCSIVYACSDPPPSGMLSTDPAFVAPPKSLPRPSEGVCNRQEPSHTGHPHPVLYAALRRCLLPGKLGVLDRVKSVICCRGLQYPPVENPRRRNCTGSKEKVACLLNN